MVFKKKLIILVLMSLFIIPCLTLGLNISSDSNINTNLNNYETFFINKDIMFSFFSIIIYCVFLYVGINYNISSLLIINFIFGFLLGLTWNIMFNNIIFVMFSIFNGYLIFIEWKK